MAEELGVFKPDVAIFARVCELSSLAPADVLYVGDSPLEDIIPARKAGLRTAWLRREGPELARWAAEACADHELADVRDVVALVG